MTDFEWRRIVVLLAENWPHQLQGEESLAKFRRDLDGFPVDQVLAAIETLYRDGREFPPNGGQILGRLAQLYADPPDWFEALREIRRALRKASDLIVEDDSDKGWRYEDERMTYLERSAPFVRAFIRQIGIDTINLSDGNDEARLRQKYERFVARNHERLVYGGIAPAGLPKLERVVDGELVEGRAGQLPPRVIPIEGGGVRRIEQGREPARKMGFGAVASHARSEGA
jgi:hypothetical protein